MFLKNLTITNHQDLPNVPHLESSINLYSNILKKLKYNKICQSISIIKHIVNIGLLLIEYNILSTIEVYC